VKKFNYLVYFNLAFCLFIILWGAWVRLSGSGAGCGEHWPLCDGEVIPLAPDIKKLIEFTHRITSGIFGITILWMTIWAYRLKDLCASGKKSALAALIFTIIEALIGAVLVKKGLVADNSSMARAWVMGLHLVNTFFLVGSLVFTLFFISKRDEKKGDVSSWWYVSLFLVLIVGATGAIAALGDTLFPSTSLIDGVKKDFDRSSNILIRLRLLHPLFALSTCALFLKLLFENFGVTKEDKLFTFIIFATLFLGFLNWVLLAPNWLVLVHLFMANILWIFALRQVLLRKFGES
jgi:cytochrome c oxidase assembly protein subunit 15